MLIETVCVEDLPVEEEILAFTHHKRKAIVSELTKTGIPTDTGSIKLLLSTLDGMDHSALSRKRLKIEENTNKNQEQAAALIAKVLSEASLKKPYRHDSNQLGFIPTLDSSIPEPDLVYGETSIVEVLPSFNEFMEVRDQ